MNERAVYTEAKETTGRTDGLPLAAVNFGQGRTRTGTSERQGWPPCWRITVLLARNND